MSESSELDVALRVAAVLDDLGIEYALGGSLASSLQGEPRSTNDVDFKIDLFMRGATAFDRSELGRRVRVTLGDRSLSAATAEDNILRKLMWFREGGSVSDRQWRDVLGLMRVGGSRLDRAYLQQWATALAIDDLLDDAFTQANLG